MKTLERIKAFGMNNQMITEDLQQIGKRFAIDLGHGTAAGSVEDTFYPQFSMAIRSEAAQMGAHYEVFYSLEKTIRALVSDTIETAEKTEEWWASARVPDQIKKDVADRIKKEEEAAMTRRSTDELDYTTFGELSVIITNNWDIFGQLFRHRKAVEKVMSNLNSLRNPIAHCSPLAADEVKRLELALSDWFRLME